MTLIEQKVARELLVSTKVEVKDEQGRWIDERAGKNPGI